jgi:thiaminase
MQVAEIKKILDKLDEEVDEKSKAKMKTHFANAYKYEYLFWEMAYNLRD